MEAVPATAALMIVGLLRVRRREHHDGREAEHDDRRGRQEGDGRRARRVLREAVRLLAQELMEFDVSELIGAAHGERNPDGRVTQRNGYRGREWHTRVGVIELGIPKLRQGSYFPHSLLEPRKRGEQALLSVVQQAYVCGVSTRRVDQLVETLGLRVSKSEVSRICELLDEQVEAFRTRPLEGEYPYLWLDAKVERCATAAGSCTRRW